jgi:uncharacterized DUF497 family protein
MAPLFAMEFEFDAAKSSTNKVKHGIDFVEAQALWNDPFLLEAPARVTDEPRFLAIGTIAGLHWTAVFTPRGGIDFRAQSAARGDRAL